MQASEKPSRAARIRELYHSGVTEEEIADICAREYGEARRPHRRAIHRAANYRPTGKPAGRPRKYPSYRQLAMELVDAWHEARESEIGVIGTRRIKRVVIAAETMLQDEGIRDR